MTTIFDSRNPRYRNPLGAVSSGTEIHFKITLPRSANCSSCHLILKQEDVKTHCNVMYWCGMNGEHAEWWECHFKPETAGLFFYHFEYHTEHGTPGIYKGTDSKAALGGTNTWQLTVFDENPTAPSWLYGGIMYQIFPDRFARSKSEHANIPDGRTLHNDWYETPDWKPNGAGKVTNSDYFGGDLLGITEKLSYLKSLGVTCLYLNPIFEAHSNHRYNTADYSKIDPMLGTESDFQDLCKTAKTFGIRIILDGVFSHTGSDSIYFNRENRYPPNGAYNTQDSPYVNWYKFKRWPDEYESWWNFDTLPNVDELNSDYDSYVNGDAGVIQNWIRQGASGWRLDVADELPDKFLDNISKSLHEENQDALLIGEVWEDASNKSAYGVRRKYLLGQQFDSVMNYPFRNSILGFLGGESVADAINIIESILENYPPHSIKTLMNHIGTHDTERVLSALAGNPVQNHDRAWQSDQRLSTEQMKTGIQKLKLASLMQFTLPGVPCIYYGDEAGMEGYKDPFNRACYPWNRENQTLISWYQSLSELRRSHPSFSDINFETCFVSSDCLSYRRFLVDQNNPLNRTEEITIYINRSDKLPVVPHEKIPSSGVCLLGVDLRETNELPPFSCSVLKTIFT